MPIARALSHSLLIAALLLSPKGWASELEEINRLSEQGKMAQALQRLNGYLGKQPTDTKALFLKGVLLAESNKHDEAIKVFSEFTKKYPQLPAPYNNLAVLYAYQGNYEKAKAALEAAIRTHPSYATAHENLGDIYARMASESYNRALQLDTTNSRAKSKLALIKDLLPPPGNIAAAKAPSKEAAKPGFALAPAPEKPTETSKPPALPEVAAIAAAPEADQTQAVMNAVESWAKAWSSQNVKQYLASYAKDFKTLTGESRSSWEATRKTRIGKPSRIEVKLTNVKINMENEHTARAAFQQSYKADHLSQRTRKQLVLVQQQGKWLIQQELTNQ